MDYREARALMASARNPANGKPLQNNTRLYEQRVNAGPLGIAYAVRLHYTDVVTILPDNRYVLRTGGWNTPTTRDRIRAYAPAQNLYSERGDWWLKCRPVAEDPEPEYPYPEICHPFPAHDPGPEPIKDPRGCEHGVRHVIGGTHTKIIYGETPCNYKTHYGPDTRGALVDVPSGWIYRQCPHCAAFTARHEQWYTAMYGPRWGRGHGKGWELHCEMVERFSSVQEWKAAAKVDGSRVYKGRKLWREWRDRNRIGFFEGVVIDSDGYPLRKDVDAYFKQQRVEERAERRRQRANEARLRRERHLARLRAGYDQRRAAREPKFIQIANDVANELRSLRDDVRETTTNSS